MQRLTGGKAMVKIEPARIPEHKLLLSYMELGDTIEQYFRNPEHVAAFEKWKAEREEKLRNTGEKQ